MPAGALDVLTLWRQPELPLRLRAGAWAEYRQGTMAGGPQDEDLVRIQVVGGSEAAGWTVEVLPLDESSGRRVPVPGEGVAIDLLPAFSRRQGRMVDVVAKVTRWQKGKARQMPAEEWRDDPLVASSLEEFTLDRVREAGATVRVVAGQSLQARQLILAAADTQRVRLPRGDMLQTVEREISVALADPVPFLGIAYASERVVAKSVLDPPSDRFKAPPPEVRVQTLELLAFGADAVPLLGRR